MGTRIVLGIALMFALSASAPGDTGPVPALKTRIVVAPFCGLSSHNPEFSEKMVAEVGRYCNAIYLAPWLFLDRKPSYKEYPNDFDPTELNYLLDVTSRAGLPSILTLHWGPTGQPDMMEWIARKYAPSEVWQIRIDGTQARSPDDPFENHVCLVHPGVRAEIDDTYRKAMDAAKAHPGYRYVLAVGGTTEPMISRGHIRDAKDWEPSGFCFNKAHVDWWRVYLKNRWKKIEAFNEAFGTAYRSFDEVEPPKSLDASPLSAEYERGLRTSLCDYMVWEKKVMRRFEPELPLLNHICSITGIVGGGVRGSYTTFDAGSAEPGVPGGSIYTVPGHIADYAAIQMDAHRSFRRDDFAAIELGIVGTWDGRGEEYRVWYSQMAARFEHVWTAPYAWTGGGSNLRETDARDAFPWAAKLGTLDVGRPTLPKVALLTNYSAWSWDCKRARDAQLECYRALFDAGIDRVLVSEFQVEKDWLAKNKVRALVLAEPFVISHTVLQNILAAQKNGIVVAVEGAFPEKDELGKPLPAEELDAVRTNRNTLMVSSAGELPDTLRSRLRLTNCLPGLEVIETDRGWCVVNVSHCRDAQRVTDAPEKQTVRLAIEGKEVDVPVQYFTFLDRRTGRATWIDPSGDWHSQ